MAMTTEEPNGPREPGRSNADDSGLSAGARGSAAEVARASDAAEQADVSAHQSVQKADVVERLVPVARGA